MADSAPSGQMRDAERAILDPGQSTVQQKIAAIEVLSQTASVRTVRLLCSAFEMSEEPPAPAAAPGRFPGGEISARAALLPTVSIT